MSLVNVIPSAPELYPMNESTQINAEDIRLKKISDLQTELKNETDHYRQVAKSKKEHIILLTTQLWVSVRFLRGCHQQPLQQP